MEISPADRRFIRKKLLDWYDRERRSLPWREHPSPYGTVVSEFMLQQTRVAAVVPYFKRFVRRFPSFKALSRASEEEVLAAWSGLGYYRRARALKRAAEIIVARHRGALPRDPEDLKGLPGFGQYTAAAVASIAQGLPLAAVDGNVRRVLARLFVIGGRSETRRIAAMATDLLDPGRPGDWNQAVMELGATVCTPRDPRCLICPLRRRCRALETGKVDRFPRPRRLPPVQRVEEVAVAALRRGALLVLQRGEGGSFAGMWELPRLDSRRIEAKNLTPDFVLFELTRLRAGDYSLLGRTESTFTHPRIRTRLYCTRSLRAGAVRRQEHIAQRWVRPGDLDALAASKAQRRLFALVAGQ